MRLNLTLFILLLLGYTANAQNLTGIWRGYFSSSSNGVYKGSREETYKYEIQIDQQSNDGVKGVTYSYKSTVFYGKAELQGIFTGSSRSMVFKETHLVDIKIGDKSEPCLMTCYLDYSRVGKLEMLEGTFISINVKDKSDCGSGKVYLEKVSTSDFKLEDFLVKKKSGDTDKTTGRSNIPPRNNATVQKPAGSNSSGDPSSQQKPAFTPPVSKDRKDNLAAKVIPVKPQGPSAQKTIIQPGNNPPVVKQDNKLTTGKTKPSAKKDNAPQPQVVPGIRIPENTQDEKAPDLKKTEQVIAVPQQSAQSQKMPIPKVLVDRENRLARIFTTSEEEIEVAIYDNGTIDNDTISVYLDNQLVVSHGRLTKSPIMVKIRSSKTNNRHEFVMVAENLGEIPPNTALMVINPNRKDRTEIFLASTEQQNSKVIINYVPKE